MIPQALGVSSVFVRFVVGIFVIKARLLFVQCVLHADVATRNVVHLDRRHRLSSAKVLEHGLLDSLQILRTVGVVHVTGLDVELEVWCVVLIIIREGQI